MDKWRDLALRGARARLLEPWHVPGTGQGPSGHAVCDQSVTRQLSNHVLSLRELNRATLARQLLLQRRRLSPAAVIERLAGMQAQWPPAPYVGIWSRVTSFRRETLERSILAGEVIKPTVMRGTLHLVTTRDYTMFFAAFTDMNTWFDGTHLEQALKIVPGMLALAEAGPMTMKEALKHMEDEHGHVDIEARRIFHAVRRRAHLLHGAETALWSARPLCGLQHTRNPQRWTRSRRVPSSCAATSLPSARPTAGRLRRLVGAARRRLRRAAPRALEPLRRFRDDPARAPRSAARPASGRRHAGTGALPPEVGQRAARARGPPAGDLGRAPQSRSGEERGRRADLPRRRVRRRGRGRPRRAACSSSRSRRCRAARVASWTTKPRGWRPGSGPSPRRP